jgi:mono/diheme cytochrome c family protein
MLQCQGCHTPDGRGVPGRVPSFKGFLGKFLQVDGGREFLVRVPGAAQSPLTDAELAALTNWMLRHFSAAELPTKFDPYGEAEVARLRSQPLVEVSAERRRLLENMAARGIDITEP